MTPDQLETSTGANQSTKTYVAIVAVAACVSFAGVIGVAGLPDRPSWVAALVVLGLVAATGRPQAIGSRQLSVSGVVQIAAIPLIGPVGAALVAALPIVLDRKGAVKDIFNAAQRLLLVLVGAGAYHLAGGQQLTSWETHPVALGVQLGAAAFGAAVTNAVLLAGVLHVSAAGSLRVIVADLLRQALPVYLGYAVAAYLLVILWAPAGLGWGSVLFFLPSLLVFQWGLRQYATEWATRHEVLAPFVEALDLRHPGAAEEARLVAGAASEVATGVGLSPGEVDEVTTAARLRDVGMLALDGAPAAIIRRDHATSARRVLGSVTFLEAPLQIVAAHHERVDGQGHPRGLAGEAIPIGARVIAVADTWGQQVAEGWTPAAAVARCEQLAGSALDTECVSALRRALDRDRLPARGETT